MKELFFNLQRFKETPAEEIPMLALEAFVCKTLEVYILPSVYQILTDLGWITEQERRQIPPMSPEQARAIVAVDKSFLNFWAAYTFDEIVGQYALAYVQMYIHKSDRVMEIIRTKNFHYLPERVTIHKSNLKNLRRATYLANARAKRKEDKKSSVSDDDSSDIYA